MNIVEKVQISSQQNSIFIHIHFMRTIKDNQLWVADFGL